MVVWIDASRVKWNFSVCEQEVGNKQEHQVLGELLNSFVWNIDKRVMWENGKKW